MAIVRVRGTASLPGIPDEATVSIEVEALQPSADKAYEDVAERSAKLRSLCADLGVASAAITTAGISIGRHVEYVDGREQHRGYRAANQVVVHLEDPALAARLLQEAVVGTDARVSGPWWRIRPDNPVHAEARRLAAEDARRRAETYAAALGVRLGALESVTEAEVRVGGPTPGPRMLAAMDGAPPIEVSPGELQVSAAVEVSFLLEQA